MERTASLKLIGVAFAVYGGSVALLVPGLAIASAPLLLAGVLAEAIAAFAAAVGFWRETNWAPVAAIALGAAIVAMQLFEGPVLGLIANGRAVLVGAGSLVLMIVVAGYARHARGSRVRA